MARIRCVKPEFFRHEALFDLELETKLPIRVAYVGLWCCCDREGRFRWRSRQLKSEILPYDNIDFDDILNALFEKQFIVKYRVSCEDYGFIPSWNRHQVINNRESESSLPEPEESFCLQPVDACPTRAPREVHVMVTRAQSRKAEGKGREGERKGKEGGASAFTLPDWIDPDVWSEYERMRGRIKKPAGDFTRKRTIGDLTKLRACGHDANEILGRSIDGCWTGVFAPKNFNPKSNGKLNLDELYAEDENGSPELTRKT